MPHQTSVGALRLNTQLLNYRWRSGESELRVISFQHQTIRLVAIRS